MELFYSLRRFSIPVVNDSRNQERLVFQVGRMADRWVSKVKSRIFLGIGTGIIMKNQAIIKKNASLKPFCWVLVCCLALTSSVGAAKSLYVAGNSENESEDTLWVYDVQPSGKLVFQTSRNLPNGGAVGLAPGLGVNGLGVDPNSDTLFLTYEGGRQAGTVDSQTLEWKKFIYLVPVDMYPGGMAFDVVRSRLYTTDVNLENKDRLIIYNWVAELEQLHNIGYGASEVPLAGFTSGAIAYDHSTDRVYVASIGSGIEVLRAAHDRGDWEQIGNFGSPFQVGALSADARNQYLYAGGRTSQGATINQYDLDTGAEMQAIVGGSTETVLSVCVDNATSLVYVLTGNVLVPTRTISIYDSSFHLIQSTAIAGDALELFVPSTSVGYNPLNVTKTPVSGTVLNNGQHSASPGSEITYEICMTNANLFAVTDIILTDPLPEELEFVRAEDLGDALGVFDQLSHTYYYHNQSVAPNSTECFSLVARVKEDAIPGTVITNSVVVDSNETPQSGASVDVEVGFNTLGLSKTVVDDPNHLKVGNTIYVDAGANLTYQICLNNLNNASEVSNVLVVDQLSPYVEFVSAEQVGLISHYDPGNHSYSWAFDVVEPNFLDCFNITVRIKHDVPPGQLVSNEVMLGSSDSPTVTVKADVVVKYDSLVANIGIHESSDYNPVTQQVVRGGILIYVIDVDNVDPVYPAENIIVIDSIPEGLQFIGVTPPDVNGIYDPLSRTFTYAQPILGPNQSIHMELTCLVDDNVPVNTILTNTVTVMANGAPASSDSISVSVYDPGSGGTIVPTTLDLYYTGPLVRYDNADEIMVIMKCPVHINMEDIDTTQPLIMTPGPSTAYYAGGATGLLTVYYMYEGIDGKVTVKGFFDRDPVLNTIQPGQESVNITVTGSLRTGQVFVGQTSVSLK